MKRPLRNDLYPPSRHVETDREKLYAVMERFPFATIISCGGAEPLITHAPLTLDRTRGKQGVLFGHMDVHNPQLALMDDRRVLVAFHGPNAYITPFAYTTDQLPTWNSISVHVRGTVRKLTNRADTIRGLAGICERCDPGEGRYRLALDDPRIEDLIAYIVGFEITIEDVIGRLKLSQDRNEADRARAKEVLVRASERSERELIDFLCNEV
jgi:predicted FMN-binding regulatory protein PaiB